MTTNNNGGLVPELEEATFYTVIGPDGDIDYIDAESMFEAYVQAYNTYGRGVVIRQTWYGEWDCGTEPGGPCYHDKYGVHHKRDADGNYKPATGDRYGADDTELEAMNG